MRYTWIEVLIAIAVFLMAASIVWHAELIEVESKVFESIGMGGPWKYLVTGPLAGLWFYSIYKREAKKRKQVVGKPVIIFVAISMIGLVTLIVIALNSGNGT